MGSTDSFRPNSRILKGRDLITVGIFTALYFAVNFVCMLLSGLHPYLWVFMPALDGRLRRFRSCWHAPRFPSSGPCSSWEWFRLWFAS